MTITTPAKISSELSHIWESLKDLNKTRACLFNLIIYSPDNERTPYIRMITKTVVEKFPCRIIFVLETKEKEKLETKVSVISPSKEASEIACDFIEINVSKDWQNRIPFTILPHLLPDLPVCLLWGEDPSVKHPVLEQLEKYVSRMIFDSECTKNLSKFASTMLERQKNYHSDIADLNWARTESWRNMLSATLYSSEHVKMLKRIKSMTVQYNSFSTPFFLHPKVQAVYLQGWIGAQLGWNYKKSSTSEEKSTIEYEKNGQKIEVILSPTSHSNLPSGNLLALEFFTTDDEHAKFSRNVDMPQQIRIEMSSKEKCDLPSHFLFSKSHLGLSLVKEVCHKGTNAHYISLLQLLTKTDLSC